jgi:hypothetical protein
MIKKLIMIIIPLCAACIIAVFLSGKLKSAVPILEIETEITAKDFFQLFYNLGKGFNEKNSTKTNVEPSEEIQRLVFELPKRGVEKIRIDPLTKSGEIKIYSIEFRLFLFSKKYNPAMIAREFRPVNHISIFEDKNTYLRIVSTGRDPHFVFEGFYNYEMMLLRRRNIMAIIAVSLLSAILTLILIKLIFSLKIFKNGVNDTRP